MNLSFLITSCFVIINNNDFALCVRAQASNDDDEVGCAHAHLADFHYEIILALATYPAETFCSQEEENAISSLLQRQINNYLDTLPGTITTNNKVCKNPINNRRRWLLPVDPTEIDERMLHRTGQRRSYIYVGGGKCRFCLNDNFDHRALVPAKQRPLLAYNTTVHEQNALREHDNRDGRELLYLYGLSTSPLPKVADINLCHQSRKAVFFFNRRNREIKWSNRKYNAAFRDKKLGITNKNLMGLYFPGDSLGAQMTMSAIRSRNQRFQKDALVIQKGQRSRWKRRRKQSDFLHKLVKEPVKRGSFTFNLWVFDLPPELSMGMLADDPLYLFINGLKLDFNLLISQPGTKRTKSFYSEELSGSSFAGIQWKIIKRRRRSYGNEVRDFAFGPETDLKYQFKVTAPLVVFLHKNQLDLDILIKPNAKAKQYAFSDLHVNLEAAKCEVTDLENSPFDDFKSVVESRLFHKLGVELARKFQDKQGHCLNDKIPVVDVHLVEKKDWRETNPHCGA